MKEKIAKWPGGIGTLSGGTRNQIKLSRPWQKEMVVDQKTCPFENLPQNIVREFNDGISTWKVIKNTNTPYSFHLLIIPEHCWRKEELQALGGFAEIKTVFSIFEEILKKYKKNGTVILGVHIGYSAGQNTGHLHWHVIEVSQEDGDNIVEEEIKKYAKKIQLRILDDMAISVVAGGQRGGQCFFVPKKESQKNTQKSLVLNVSEIVNLYNDKFMSIEGIPPEYMLGFKFREQRFRYGFYTPILNHLGFPEYFSLLGESPKTITLPWPHEETVAHLRGT